MSYRGDLGMFRACLLLSGFFERSECNMFNDRSKTRGTRRLKLWFANPVFVASQEQQQVLANLLRDAFGARILSMYFTVHEGGRFGNFESLCIKLQD